MLEAIIGTTSPWLGLVQSSALGKSSGFRLGLGVVGKVIRSKKSVVRIERGEALQEVVDADLGGVLVANRG